MSAIPKPPAPRAIVLFAHGARDPRWAEPFEATATRIRAAAPGRLVMVAFLEAMAPTLGEAVDRLVAAGAQALDIVPMFLGTGGHLRRDLPSLIDAVRAAHPSLDVRLHAALGEAPAVIDAMAAAALAAADGTAVNNSSLRSEGGAA